MFCAFPTKAQNLILNGSFELNNATNCTEELQYYEWNSKVQYSTAYGDFSVLMKDSCERCSSQTFFGGGCKMEID